MSITMIIILFIGTWAMMMPMFFQARKYDIQRWKIIPVAFILTIVGTLGTYIWFLIENFSWGGRSFYGAVFIVPIVFLALPKIVKIPYGQLVDLCAPAECIMLSLMKVQCLVSGCCAGRTLFMTEAGEIVRFPSQAVELAAAYVIAIVLLILSHRKGFKEKVFPWYMILYGSSRFVLNFMREEWELYDGGLIPMGTIWSVVAVAIGICWIVIYNKKKAKSEEAVSA